MPSALQSPIHLVTTLAPVNFGFQEWVLLLCAISSASLQCVSVCVWMYSLYPCVCECTVCILVCVDVQSVSLHVWMYSLSMCVWMYFLYPCVWMYIMWPCVCVCVCVYTLCGNWQRYRWNKIKSMLGRLGFFVRKIGFMYVWKLGRLVL